MFWTCHQSISNLAKRANNWRDLSINTKSNRLLIRQSLNNILEKDIFNLKHIKKRVYIILSLLNNTYIISYIKFL